MQVKEASVEHFEISQEVQTGDHSGRDTVDKRNRHNCKHYRVFARVQNDNNSV